MPHFEGKSLTQPGAVEDAESRAQRIRVKNRRFRYLELHPEYFKHPSLELADPLLYDRWVRQFQSPAERQAEGRGSGFSGMLESNILRSEAKIHALHHPDPNNPMVYIQATDGSVIGVEEDEEDRAHSKDEGWEKWKEVMTLRFLQGRDEDFEYASVDGNEEFDDQAEEDRKRLEEYLNGDDEEFESEGTLRGYTGVQDF